MNNLKGNLVITEYIKNNGTILTSKDKEGNHCSLFHQNEIYDFEIVLFKDDSRLILAFNYLTVVEQKVIIEDKEAESYLPILMRK